MVRSKIIYLVRPMFLLAIWFLVCNMYYAAAEDVHGGGISGANPCLNCSVCQYPCHPQPPPPSVYQSYGAPPPPPSGDQSYGAPLPPPPPAAVGGNCPPTIVQCCQYPPPMPYTPLPYDSHSGALIQPLSTMSASVIFLLLHFVFVFYV